MCILNAGFLLFHVFLTFFLTDLFFVPFGIAEANRSAFSAGGYGLLITGYPSLTLGVGTGSIGKIDIRRPPAAMG